MTPDQARQHLERAGVHPRTLTAASGGVVVCAEAAGRVCGIWPDPAGPNLLWLNPRPITDPALRGGWRGYPEGGLGGERIWLGPEHRYFWDGTPRRDLANWAVPESQDPGDYRERSPTDRVGYQQRLRLGDRTQAEVTRTVRIVSSSPEADCLGLSMQDTRSLTLETDAPDARLDVWTIGQFRAGTRFVVPTTGRPEVGVGYEAEPGQVRRRSVVGDDHVLWDVSGSSMVKGHLAAGDVSGDLLTIESLDDGRSAVTLRTFRVDLDSAYEDALFPQDVGRQCVQWWDGLGYGELEHHSPTLSAQRPSWTESQTVHAWVGLPKDLHAVVGRRLQRDLPIDWFDTTGATLT